MNTARGRNTQGKCINAVDLERLDLGVPSLSMVPYGMVECIVSDNLACPGFQGSGTYVKEAGPSRVNRHLVRPP